MSWVSLISARRSLSSYLQRSIFPLGFTIAIVAMFAAIYLGWISFDKSSQLIVMVADSELEKRSAHLANVQASIDSAASMLLNIQLGLFLAVGFACGLYFKNTRQLPVTAAVFCLGFVATAIVALHFGLVARILTAQHMAAGYLFYDDVIDLLLEQALWMAASTLFGLGAAAFLLNYKEQAAQEPKGRSPLETSPAPTSSVALTALFILAPSILVSPEARAQSFASERCTTTQLMAVHQSLPLLIAEDPNPLPPGRSGKESDDTDGRQPTWADLNLTCRTDDYAGLMRRYPHGDEQLEAAKGMIVEPGLFDGSDTLRKIDTSLEQMARSNQDALGPIDPERERLLRKYFELQMRSMDVLKEERIGAAAKSHNASRKPGGVPVPTPRPDSSATVPVFSEIGRVGIARNAFVIRRQEDEARAALYASLMRTKMLRIDSVPVGAAVYFQGRRLGLTSASAWGHLETLEGIELRLDGYEPCSFKMAYVVGASFFCEMRALMPQSE